MPDPILSITPASAVEYDYLDFVITLSEPVVDVATVDYQILSGTAERADDISTSTNAFLGTITFAPGADSATIRLWANSDNLDELDENFTLRLFNADGVSFGSNVHSLASTGWVLDQDGVGLNRAMAVAGPVVSEAAGGRAVFTISLSEAFDEDRSFSFSTQDGTARAGSDYVARSGTVTFLAGQTTATVTVNLVNDGTAEGTESFSLAVTGAHNVTGATGTTTIVDDDTALPVVSVEGEASTEYNQVIYTVRLSEAASDAVTVNYNMMSGTGTRDDDVTASNPLTGTVTFAPGETVKTITLWANSDSVDELDESVMIQLYDPAGARFGTNRHGETAIGWALDNDGAGNNRAIEVSDIVINEAAGGTAVFTISLSEAFDSDRSFTYATRNGSAESGSDYVSTSGTITFRAGQTEAVVELDLRDDSVAEAGERFSLIVDAAHGVAAASGTALIMDDDSRQPIITIDSTAIPEYNYLVHTVRLSEPAADAVTVAYTAIDGSAIVGTDLGASTSPLTGTITFAPGQTTQQIVLWADSDSLDELDESYFIRLHDPVGAGFGGDNRSLTATGWVLDNDGPGLNRTVAVSGAEIREGPGGRVAVFAVEISTPATSELSLNFQTVAGTARAGADFTARSGAITFEPGQTRVEIAVPITNDLALEGSEQFSLRVIPPFPTQLSSSATTAIGTATILDGTLRGTDGANRLTGTSYAERIEGFGGDDVISGRDGNDLLSGGAGRDLLDGGAGRDTMAGGNGNDRYVIDALDVISESRSGGIDSVDARHSMTLGANLENLRLLGSANLRGNGNDLANALTGNAGRNVLDGRDGNDSLAGAAGNDTLKGGDGRDLLRGDTGTDLLYGGVDGADRDVFLFRSTAHSAVGSARDRVYDFRSGVDDIDLRGIDANENRGGNQVFDFTGRQAEDYAVWIVRSGANVIVRGDTDGDARTDFEILVAGNTRLAEGDFLL